MNNQRFPPMVLHVWSALFYSLKCIKTLTFYFMRRIFFFSFTYVRMHWKWKWWCVSILHWRHYQSRYCDVTTTTAHCKVKETKMLWHPHGYSWNTLRGSTVSTCSEWMESNWKDQNSSTLPGQIDNNGHLDLEWQKSLKSEIFLKAAQVCTIIVVTTIVRFSTEEDSLVTCWSIT